MIGVALHSDVGITLTGPNTTFSDYKVKELVGKGKIVFRIPSLPLLAGTYELSVSIYDFPGIRPYDYHYRRYSFNVVNNANKEIYGFIHVPHTWEHHL